MNNSEFELVYQKYAKQLFYFLLKLCGDYDMAEDLAQETFMRAYQSIDSFRGDCRLDVWLCKIGKNLFYNQQRRDDRLAGSDGMEKMPGNENIEEATIRSHMARDVIKQVRTVPEPYQTVFLLRIILEYDYKKIGEC